jgi:hypothetical protein
MQQLPPFRSDALRRRLVEASITHCNTPWIASLILVFSIHRKWRAASQISDCSDNPTKNSGGLRNQEIMVASLNHETVRSNDTEIFRATSPYPFVLHVMWRHLAGITLSHVCSQPNSRACSTYLRPWKPLHSSHCCILLNIKTPSFLLGHVERKPPILCPSCTDAITVIRGHSISGGKSSENPTVHIF